MSSRESAAPLRLEFQPSRLRRQWRALTHLAALVCLPLLQSSWLAAAIFGVIAFSWHASRCEPALTLLWHGDGRWSLFEDGREFGVALAGAPFVQVWLVLLPLRVEGRRRMRRIAVFPDQLPATEFRRLRVRLRQLSCEGCPS